MPVPFGRILSTESTFGILGSLDSDVGTTALMIIILAVLTSEQLFHQLHELTHETAFFGMVTKIQKELMIVGCTAFIFKLIINSTDSIPTNWFHALEFADVLIPLFSFSYCFLAIILIMVSLHLCQLRSRAHNMKLVDLIDDFYVKAENISFKYFIWKPISGIIQQLEFRIYQNIFCEMFHTSREALAFDEYAQRIFEKFVEDIIEIRLMDWFFICVLILLNFARNLLGWNYFNCENRTEEHDHQECVDESDTHLFIIAGAFLYGISLLVTIISRKLELSIMASKRIDTFHDYTHFLKEMEDVTYSPHSHSSKIQMNEEQLKQVILAAHKEKSQHHEENYNFVTDFINFVGSSISAVYDSIFGDKVEKERQQKEVKDLIERITQESHRKAVVQRVSAARSVIRQSVRNHDLVARSQDRPTLPRVESNGLTLDTSERSNGGNNTQTSLMNSPSLSLRNLSTEFLTLTRASSKSKIHPISTTEDVELGPTESDIIRNVNRLQEIREDTNETRGRAFSTDIESTHNIESSPVFNHPLKHEFQRIPDVESESDFIETPTDEYRDETVNENKELLQKSLQAAMQMRKKASNNSAKKMVALISSAKSSSALTSPNRSPSSPTKPKLLPPIVKNRNSDYEIAEVTGSESKLDDGGSGKHTPSAPNSVKLSKKERDNSSGFIQRSLRFTMALPFLKQPSAQTMESTSGKSEHNFTERKAKDLDDSRVKQQDEIAQLFFFKSPQIYFECVKLLILLISMYTSLWATNFYFTSPNSAWKVLTVLPAILSSINYVYIVKCAAMLKAIYQFDYETALEVMEQTEGSRLLGEEMRRKVMHELKKNGDDPHKELYHLYQMIDTDGSNFITRSELVLFMTHMGINFSNKKWKQIYHVLDRNGDNAINFQEFFLYIFPNHLAAKELEAIRLENVHARVREHFQKHPNTKWSFMNVFQEAVQESHMHHKSSTTAEHGK